MKPIEACGAIKKPEEGPPEGMPTPEEFAML